MLARLHVNAWEETYRGLLPDGEFKKRPYAVRLAQWQDQIARGTSRIAVAPDLGFAQVGPQRDDALRDEWPEELYALYVLRRAHGSGLAQALLAATAGDRPFTALVLDGNDRALAFYRKTGAVERARIPLGDGWPDDILLGWPAPFAPLI